MPIISGSRGITPEVPHVPKGTEEKVDALINNCREMPAPALYEMVHSQLPEWAVEQMLQLAGNKGTLQQYKNSVTAGDFEAVAAMMPTPEFVGHCLEKLKEPGVFRQFEKFARGQG